jgi:hypothetical protein
MSKICMFQCKWLWKFVRFIAQICAPAWCKWSQNWLKIVVRKLCLCNWWNETCSQWIVAMFGLLQLSYKLVTKAQLTYTLITTNFTSFMQTHNKQFIYTWIMHLVPNTNFENFSKVQFWQCFFNRVQPLY